MILTERNTNSVEMRTEEFLVRKQSEENVRAGTSEVH